MNLLSAGLVGLVSVGLFGGRVQKNICPMFPDSEVISRKEVEGPEGRKYVVFDVHNGYAIYEHRREGLSFVEGSYHTNSPFYTLKTNKKLYYFGPGDYFFGDEDMAKSVLGNEVIRPFEVRKSEKVEQDNSVFLKNSGKSGGDGDTPIEVNDFKTIERGDYFRNLTYFPENWFGECGLIALSEILSYLDTFENDGFIPNNLTYDGRDYYRTADSANLLKDTSPSDAGRPNNPYIIKNQPLIRKSEVSSTDYHCWEQMPGTNYSMRDYLFDKYMHTFMGIRDYSKGFPMMDGELKNTFNDYINANCDASVKGNYNIISGHLWNTQGNLKKSIDDNRPVAAVLRSYVTVDPATGKKKESGNNHVVIVYGYKDQNFLANFGWWPDRKDYTEIVIHDPNVYGYFSVKYTGSHVCSQNAILNGSGVCGCGKISNKENNN